MINTRPLITQHADEQQRDVQLPKKELDPWTGADLIEHNSVLWSELDFRGKLKRVCLQWIGKALGLVALLYIFVCSLDLMSSAFRLLGGKVAGKAFSDNQLIRNPVAGLVIGVLATVLVQSSSTSTSIVVGMVASGLLGVRPAIPIIMGANIGTSITNTVVSLAHTANRDEFRRAFGGATVLDMFNWLAVLVLLPIEVITGAIAGKGYLEWLTGLIIQSMDLESSSASNVQLLKVLTEPLTQRVVQVDKVTIARIATGVPLGIHNRLLKRWCETKMVMAEKQLTTSPPSIGLQTATTTQPPSQNMTEVGVKKCLFLFHGADMSDAAVGGILLVISLSSLCICLILLVKLLQSILRGKLAGIIKRTVNADLPGRLGYFTGYMAILVGAGLTILVQSSSVFTSALTPLVGIGVIRLERMYPLTLGANLGTTCTGILAALASSSTKDELAPALQIAFCHLFFNLSGILIFFPVPQMRWPIGMAKAMGNTTAKYRWFPLIYVAGMFFMFPAAVFALSMAGVVPLTAVGGPLLATFLIVMLINGLQRRKPGWLPRKLRDWEFLPLWMHSLKPLDGVVVWLMGAVKRGFAPDEREDVAPTTHTPSCQNTKKYEDASAEVKSQVGAECVNITKTGNPVSQSCIPGKTAVNLESSV